jgi:hypothetical protein
MAVTSDMRCVMGDAADDLQDFEELRLLDRHLEDDEVELEGVFQHQTLKAYLIQVDEVNIWFPRSQITGGNFEPEKLTPGQRITFWVTAWLANEKGLA